MPDYSMGPLSTRHRRLVVPSSVTEVQSVLVA